MTGSELKDLRVNAGFKTLSEFARLICVAPESLSRCERNKQRVGRQVAILARLVSAAKLGATNDQIREILLSGNGHATNPNMSRKRPPQPCCDNCG